ncbi:MAG: hypothetical protein KKC10_01855, partial [Alphaproteobacteria bacterium]|nr:hypothetical protein [Alphaproteobacteria bacterium]
MAPGKSQVDACSSWPFSANRDSRPQPYFLSGSENALRQTSLWMMLATLARPASGSFQVKASGIDSFFLAMKSRSP